MKLTVEIKELANGNISVEAVATEIQGSTGLEQKYMAAICALLTRELPLMGNGLGARAVIPMGTKPENQ